MEHVIATVNGCPVKMWFKCTANSKFIQNNVDEAKTKIRVTSIRDNIDYSQYRYTDVEGERERIAKNGISS